MTRRQFRPDLAGQGGALESRRLLSGLAHAPAAHVSALAIVQVAGAKTGTFKSQFLADLTSVSTFKVAGNIPQLGRYTLAGTLRSIGQAAGSATGTATFAAKGGTLNIALTGPVQEAGSGLALPRDFNANVTGGTGVFAGETGSGPVNFRFHTIGKAKGGAAHGKVVVVYTLNLTPATTG